MHGATRWAALRGLHWRVRGATPLGPCLRPSQGALVEAPQRRAGARWTPGQQERTFHQLVVVVLQRGALRRSHVYCTRCAAPSCVLNCCVERHSEKSGSAQRQRKAAVHVRNAPVQALGRGTTRSGEGRTGTSGE